MRHCSIIFDRWQASSYYLLIIGVFLASANQLRSQGHPGMIVVLSGQVLEMEKQEPIPQFPLHIDQVRPFTTDDHGFFKVPVPYASGVVRVQVRHPRYEILSPPEGSKILSANLKPNSNVTLEIWVLGADASDELKNQLKAARAEVDRLRRDKTATGRQLEHLNRTLLDSIRSFNLQRQSFRSQLDSIKNRTAQYAERETELSTELRLIQGKLNDLENVNRRLVGRLTEALEERYQKQKRSHDEISAALLNYQSRLKDLRDQLKQVQFVFRSSSAGNYFIQAIQDYSDGRNELHRLQEEFREAVGHYWQDPDLTKKYDDLRHYILEDIHQGEILNLNESVILPIRESSTGKRIKQKSVTKKANETAQRLDEKILILEEQLDDFLKQLREY